MNAMQIYDRGVALMTLLAQTKTLDESTTVINELRRLHDYQCLACGCSDDDAIHQPRKGRFRTREPACPYTPRVPVHLQIAPLPLTGVSPEGTSDA